MTIKIAKTDNEINTCYSVMQELRPHINKEEFLSRVRNQERSGYQLAYVQEADEIVAVAGFRMSENLAWGKFMYVDDLVTLSAQRSKGFGSKLLSWLKEYAIKNSCSQFHLDSGTQRKEAHRFYEREGMSITGYHFFESITPK